MFFAGVVSAGSSGRAPTDKGHMGIRSGSPILGAERRDHGVTALGSSVPQAGKLTAGVWSDDERRFAAELADA